MLIAIRKNKAHQTVEAMGCADNALKAALSRVFEFCDQYARARARGVIIAKNSIKSNINSHILSIDGVDGGYNGGSKKLGSTQRLYRCIFVPPFMAVRFLFAHCLHSMGVWVRSNPPADLVRLEHPHLIGGFKSKKLGGSHA